MNLMAEQKRLYESMPKDARCFVRICDTDQALWVSDLPRRMPDAAQLSEKLAAQGFVCHLDENTRLWYIDWTAQRWEEMLSACPGSLPEFPLEECYHAAYALCRLWMLHPSEHKNLPVIRRVVKLVCEPESKVLSAIAPLHAQAAADLRSGRPFAFDAGRVLAGWLNERRKEK